MWLNPLKIGTLFCVLLASSLLKGQDVTSIENYIESSEFNKAIITADSLIAISKDQNTKARLVQLQADAYYYLNDIEKSLEYYLKAIDIHELNMEPNTLHYFECVSHAGFCYRELGVYNLALLHYLKALNLAQQLNDSTEVAAQYANLGLIYGKLGDIDKATTYHLNAYNIDLALKDTAGIGFDLRNIADLKITLGDYEEAIENIKESIELLELSGGNPNSLALRQGVLGKTYLAMGSLDSAEHYLNLSLNQHLIMKDSIHVALRWNDLAQYNFKIKQFERAVELASDAKTYFLGLGDSQYVTLSNLTLIKAYLGLSKTNKAHQIIDENISICKSKKLLVELRDTYDLQAKAFQQNNNLQKAIGAIKRFQRLQDSIININNKKSVALLEVKYEVYKIEQENEILALENELSKKQIASQRTQYLLTVAIFGILIIAITIISYIIYSRHRIKQILLQTEVDQLRTQIKLILEGDTSGLDIDQLNQQLDNPLTDREAEILNYALSDMSNGEIAEKTFVSVNTVKFHLKKVYDKIGVTSRKEALQFALKSGK